MKERSHIIDFNQRDDYHSYPPEERIQTLFYQNKNTMRYIKLLISVKFYISEKSEFHANTNGYQFYVFLEVQISVMSL